MRLDDYVKGNAETFYVRVQGDAEEDQGINDGDMLVIHDRPANSGELVLVDTGDGLVVRTQGKPRPRFRLVGSGPAFSSMLANSSLIPALLDRTEKTIGVIAFVVKRYA